MKIEIISADNNPVADFFSSSSTPETDRDEVSSQLTEKLRKYNEWRRGAEMEQPHPKDIGLWIDEICMRVDAQKERIEELWESIKKLNALHDEAFARLTVVEAERDRAKSALNDQCRGNNRLHEVNKNLLAEVIQARRERDEAREAISATKHYLTKERDDALSQIVQAECRAERFCQERDEAREERNQQARLLGMSGERELSLRGKIFELERKIQQLEAK